MKMNAFISTLAAFFILASGSAFATSATDMDGHHINKITPIALQNRNINMDKASDLDGHFQIMNQESMDTFRAKHSDASDLDGHH